MFFISIFISDEICLDAQHSWTVLEVWYRFPMHLKIASLARNMPKSTNTHLSASVVLHTYIHNWSLQCSIRIIDLVFHITYVVCFNLIISGRIRRLFEKLFMAILLVQSFCQISGERKPPKKYFLYFI